MLILDRLRANPGSLARTSVFAAGVQGLEIFVKDVAFTAIGVTTTILTIPDCRAPDPGRDAASHDLSADGAPDYARTCRCWASGRRRSSPLVYVSWRLLVITLGLLLSLGIPVKPIVIQYLPL